MGDPLGVTIGLGILTNLLSHPLCKVLDSEPVRRLYGASEDQRLGRELAGLIDRARDRLPPEQRRYIDWLGDKGLLAHDESFELHKLFGGAERPDPRRISDICRQLFAEAPPNLDAIFEAFLGQLEIELRNHEDFAPWLAYREVGETRRLVDKTHEDVSWIKAKLEAQPIQPSATSLPDADATLDMSLYAAWARARWGKIDLAAVGHAVGREGIRNIGLPALFVPPDVLPERPPSATRRQRPVSDMSRFDREHSGEAYEHQTSWNSPGRVSFLSMAGRPDRRRMLVLGDPGAGKSALARFLLLELLNAGTKELNQTDWRQALCGVLPFIIEFKEYLNERRHGEISGLLDYLGQVGRKHGCGFDAGVLTVLLEDGKALLIFDGIDEVLDLGSRASLCDEIIGLSARFPANRFLVTSRVIGSQLHAEQLENAGYHTVTLVPLNDAQQRSLVEAWYLNRYPGNSAKKSEALSTLEKEIKGSPRLAELARNPLLLTMMAKVAEEERLASSRAGLYEQVIGLFCRDLDVDIKKLGETWPVRHPYGLIDQGVFMELLGSVADAMMRDEDGIFTNLLPADHLRRVIRVHLTNLNVPAVERGHYVEATIKLLGERNWLIAERGPGTFGFIHRTFMEYLCARELALRVDDGRLSDERLVEEYILKKDQHEIAAADLDSWYEIIRLLASRLKLGAAGKLIEALTPQPPDDVPEAQFWCQATHQKRPRRLALAFECLAERTSDEIRRLREPCRKLLRAAVTWQRYGFWEPTGNGQAPEDAAMRISAALVSLGAELWRTPALVQAVPSLDEVTFGRDLPELVGAMGTTVWTGDDRPIAYLLNSATIYYWNGSRVFRALVRYFPDDPRILPAVIENFGEVQDLDWSHDLIAGIHETYGEHPEWRDAVLRYVVDHRCQWVRARLIRLLPEVVVSYVRVKEALLRVLDTDPAPEPQQAAAEILATRFGNDAEIVDALRVRRMIPSRS